jgi:hypothetical protein
MCKIPLQKILSFLGKIYFGPHSFLSTPPNDPNVTEDDDRLDFFQNPLPTFLRSLSEVLEFDRRFVLAWGVSQSTSYGSSDAVSVRMLELPVTQFGRTEWLCFRAVLKEETDPRVNEFGGILSHLSLSDSEF